MGGVLLLSRCGRQQAEIQELQLRVNLGEIYLKCREKTLKFDKNKKRNKRNKNLIDLI